MKARVVVIVVDGEVASSIELELQFESFGDFRLETMRIEVALEMVLEMALEMALMIRQHVSLGC